MMVVYRNMFQCVYVMRVHVNIDYASTVIWVRIKQGVDQMQKRGMHACLRTYQKSEVLALTH